MTNCTEIRVWKTSEIVTVCFFICILHLIFREKYQLCKKVFVTTTNE